MGHQDERWLDQTGQNMIRIVIGSYFMALSLDFVVGVDQAALFSTFLSAEAADLVGSTILLVVSLAFMVGTQLRLSSLMLAMFVLSSSMIQNFMYFEIQNLSQFWRDLALICAVMLNYSNLKTDDIYSAAMVSPKVRPRRVALDTASRKSLQREIQSALGKAQTPRPVRPVMAVPDTPKMAAPEPDHESNNIFA